MPLIAKIERARFEAESLLAELPIIDLTVAVGSHEALVSVAQQATDAGLGDEAAQLRCTAEKLMAAIQGEY